MLLATQVSKSSMRDPHEVTLIFPHQLFADHPAVETGRPIYLVEEELFFNQYNFNVKKLILHRASMKYYADTLTRAGHTVHYIEAKEQEAAVAVLVERLVNDGVQALHYADVTDDWLQKRIVRGAGTEHLLIYPTPYFLNQPEDVNEFFNEQRTYFQTNFYIHQRKKRRILLQADGKPLGSKWSFDADNRLRFPKGQPVPVFTLPKDNGYVEEAIGYVSRVFPDNYGNTEPPFFRGSGFFPVTHAEADAWLDEFLYERFANFGAYEDAMVANEGLLCHSGLTPMLNIGLLTPQQILDRALEYASENKLALNTVEGFVRQLIGWREFIHIVYSREHVKQRTTNYWGFTRKIPASFWEGKTGIAPVDIVIKKVLQTGYTHHIERLMVMGNFMLLCEFDPDEVYRWFMEMYIDAYDWVMVPNTYGMTQFADGGLMTTKPYISGSNYLMKMGNWPKGEWQDIWDGLFWRFMSVHADFFKQNPRLGMLTKTFEKMPAGKKARHLENAERFLESLDEVE